MSTLLKPPDSGNNWHRFTRVCLFNNSCYDRAVVSLLAWVFVAASHVFDKRCSPEKYYRRWCSPFLDETTKLTFTYSKSTIETRKRCEICSELTIKTPERRHWCRSSVFIVNFEHISHFFVMFLVLTLNK